MENRPQATLEFGPQHIQKMPLSELNCLTQTRKTLPQEGIDELSRAISQLPTDSGYEMVHPPAVALLTAEEAGTYLEELNLCHGSNHVLEELAPTDDGMYAIVIYGHRRIMSASQIAEQKGYDAADTFVDCSINRHISFAEALHKQINENTARPLPLYEVAKAIQARYNYGMAKGEYTTVADCIRDLPFGEQKIREALYFCALPEPIQGLVEDGRLTYGVAVALYPYQRELAQHYHDETSERLDQLITYQMMTETVKALKNRWSRDYMTSRVKGLVSDLRSLRGYDQMAMEMQMEDELLLRKRLFSEATRDLREHGANSLEAYLHLLERNPTLLAMQPQEERMELANRLLGLVESFKSLGVLGEVVESVPVYDGQESLISL